MIVPKYVEPEDCLNFEPDHNGECINCDGWYSDHEQLLPRPDDK